MKLIDKAAIIAEIKDIESSTLCEYYSNKSRYAEGSLDVIHRLKHFIDTLEVKEIDLEKEIPSKELADEIDALNKRYPEVSFAKLSRIAVRVAKWQKEQDKKGE